VKKGHDGTEHAIRRVDVAAMHPDGTSPRLAHHHGAVFVQDQGATGREAEKLEAALERRGVIIP